ncbi:MAG: hypothetical protein U9P49_00360 [Thermodesulfobacteriota bacterium]|nr:hypothetical protein [Thermodesulfobacteriota bacterium]
MNIKWFALIIIFLLPVAGCSSGSDSGSQVINRPSAEAIEALGTFPVGPNYIEYEEPIITISSPEPGYITQEDPIEVTGAVKKGTADIEGLYVNGKKVPINKAGGDFSTTIPIDDSDNPFFPIIVKAVDSNKFVSGERTMIIHGETNQLEELDNAIYLRGNGEFISNVISTALSILDGQNLAAWLPSEISREDLKVWLGGSELLLSLMLGTDGKGISPRAVIIQGIELYKKENPMGYYVEQRPDGSYNIITDLKIKKIIAEYTIIGDPALEECRNFINTQVKDVIIKEDLTINLKLEGHELYISVYVNRDVELIEGDNFDVAVNTSHTDFIDIMRDFFEYILEHLFGIELGDISMPLGLDISLFDLLMSVGGDVYTTSSNGFNYLDMNDGFLELSANAGFIIEDGLETTYATPENGPKPDLSNDIANSVIAISDDYLNQALAVFFLNENVSHMEETISIEGFPKDYWLVDENGNLVIDLTVDISTPPIIELDEANSGLVILRLRDIGIEAKVKGLTVLRLSMDTDLKMGWGPEGKGFSFKLERYPRYLIMFNRLYPLVFPSEISKVPDVIQGVLNQFCEKIGLLGLDIKETKTLNPGYINLYTDITSQRDLSKMKQTSFEEIIANEEWAYGWTSMGTEFSPGVSTSIVGNEIVFSTPEDGSTLSWNDSVMFEFTAPEGHVITGISFDPELSYSNYIGNDLDYYEEFAILCITRDGMDDENKDGIVPMSGIAVPYEIETEDISELEVQPVEFQVSPCKHIGIGLRLRRTPLQVWLHTVKAEAYAKNITIYTADMNIDVGMN